jgi:hypothetical protein
MPQAGEGGNKNSLKTTHNSHVTQTESGASEAASAVFIDGARTQN